MKLLQSARCRFSGSMKARLRPRVLEASVRWWLLLAPTAATLRRVPPSRDDDALTRRTPRSRYSFGGGGMRRPWRDDEVDEEGIVGGERMAVFKGPAGAWCLGARGAFLSALLQSCSSAPPAGKISADGVELELLE
jgi:hypothetical protein